jgi:glutaredoxin 2
MNTTLTTINNNKTTLINTVKSIVNINTLSDINSILQPIAQQFTTNNINTNGDVNGFFNNLLININTLNATQTQLNNTNGVLTQTLGNITAAITTQQTILNQINQNITSVQTAINTLNTTKTQLNTNTINVNNQINSLYQAFNVNTPTNLTNYVNTAISNNQIYLQAKITANTITSVNNVGDFKTQIWDKVYAINNNLMTKLDTWAITNNLSPQQCIWRTNTNFTPINSLMNSSVTDTLKCVKGWRLFVSSVPWNRTYSTLSNWINYQVNGLISTQFPLIETSANINMNGFSGALYVNPQNKLLIHVLMQLAIVNGAYLNYKNSVSMTNWDSMLTSGIPDPMAIALTLNVL